MELTGILRSLIQQRFKEMDFRTERTHSYCPKPLGHGRPGPELCEWPPECCPPLPSFTNTHPGIITEDHTYNLPLPSPSQTSQRYTLSTPFPPPRAPTDSSQGYTESITPSPSTASTPFLPPLVLPPFYMFLSMFYQLFVP